MNRLALVALLLGISFGTGCGDAPPATTPECVPRCNLGYTCVVGACVPACSPACAPPQSCVTRNGAAMCEGPVTTSDAAADRDDASATDVIEDIASDQGPSDVTLDAPTDDRVDATPAIDVAPDAMVMDAMVMDAMAIDAMAVDAMAMDVRPADTSPPDAITVDASPVDARPADASPADVTPADASSSDARPMDSSPTDVVSADVGDSGVRPPCGMAGLACCQGRVCIGASVCDTVAMRCVPFTPGTGECTSTLRCTGVEACGGIYVCGDRACLLCSIPGTRAPGAACTTADQCASAFCANGVCTAVCEVGPVGAVACRAMGARMVCAQFTGRARADGGTPPTTTFGGCALSCARNGDCGAGQVCRLQRNDYEDRLDQVCATPAGMLGPGAACDPNPPSGATSAMFCDNGQCSPTAEHAGFCAPFCVTDADCPSTAYACIGLMFGRPSGTPQAIRMCVRR